MNKSASTVNVYVWNNILTGLATLAVVIALIVLWAQREHAVALNAVSLAQATVVIDNTNCDDENDCTVGLYISTTPAGCAYRPLAAGTVCNSPCLTLDGGQCDGHAMCLGNHSTCAGSCDEEGDDTNCLNTIPINGDIIDTFDHNTGWAWGWSSPAHCQFGTCVAEVLEMYMGSSVNALWEDNTTTHAFYPIAARFKCTDYLDPAYFAANGSCLIVERYLLSTNLSDYEEMGCGTYGNTTYPYQLGVCVFYYACGTLTPPTTPAGVSANDAPAPAPGPAPPPKSPAQWGFTRVAEEAHLPSIGMTQKNLGWSVPQRQAFWRGLQISTVATLQGVDKQALRARVEAWALATGAVGVEKRSASSC